MKVRRICKNCGGVFYVRSSRLDHGRGIYCSRKCKGTSEQVTCATCGTTFQRPSNQIKVGANYCSRTCNHRAHNRRPWSNLDGTWSIPLTRGYVAIIDADDLPIAELCSWQASVTGRLVYARGRVNGRDIMMHQLIAQTPPGMDTDHIDGDGLNNRRSNLRVVSHSMNLLNTYKHRERKAS